jgi:hypothetical protein
MSLVISLEQEPTRAAWMAHASRQLLPSAARHRRQITSSLLCGKDEGKETRLFAHWHSPRMTLTSRHNHGSIRLTPLHRHRSMLVDEDGDTAHEFYEENAEGRLVPVESGLRPQVSLGAHPSSRTAPPPTTPLISAPPHNPLISSPRPPFFPLSSRGWSHSILRS